MLVAFICSKHCIHVANFTSPITLTRTLLNITVPLSKSKTQVEMTWPGPHGEAHIEPQDFDTHPCA